jgi:hypothetical protein
MVFLAYRWMTRYWREEQYVPSKLWYPPTRLHCVINQEATIWMFTPVKTSTFINERQIRVVTRCNITTSEPHLFLHDELICSLLWFLLEKSTEAGVGARHSIRITHLTVLQTFMACSRACSWMNYNQCNEGSESLFVAWGEASTGRTLPHVCG